MHINRYLPCLTLIVILIFSGAAQAQHYKGTIEISPTIGFTNNKSEFDGGTDEFKYRGGEFGLSLGYYIMKKVKIGLCAEGFRYFNSQNKELTSTGFYFGPIVGNAITINDKLNIPIALAFVYNRLVDDVVTNKFTYTGFGGLMRVGLEYKLNRDLGLAFMAGGHLGALDTEIQGNKFELEYINVDLKLGLNVYL